MGRYKIEIKKIEKETNRSITFHKRSHGLIKKAYELSVLCNVDIAFITFSPAGKLRYFSNQQRIETVLQRFTRNIHNLPENERLQVSQDIINLIDNMAVEGDADDQQDLDEAEKEEIIGEVTRSKAKLGKLKKLHRFFNKEMWEHTPFSEEEWEHRQKFIENKLAEVVNRKQLLSQPGSQFPIANPSLSRQNVRMQISLQHAQAGNEAEMLGRPPQGGMQLQLHRAPFVGMRYPASLSMQQIVSGQTYWAPGANPSSSMQVPYFPLHVQSANWHIQMQQQQAGTEAGMWDPQQQGEQPWLLGNPFSSSSLVQTSMPGQVTLEVRGLYDSSNNMWGPLVGGHEMPSFGAQQPSSSSWRPLGGELYGSSNYMSGPLVGRHDMPSRAQQPSLSSRCPLGGEARSIEDPEQAGD